VIGESGPDSLSTSRAEQAGTGVPLDVVLAFESLFFNVFDREREAIYVRNLAYDNTLPIVEMFEDYSKTEMVETLLLRAGYSRGFDAARVLAGIAGRSVLSTSRTAPQLAEQLEITMLSNAIISAQAGFGHQAADSVAISHAKSLLTAAKQGGVDTGTGSPVTTADTSDSLVGQMLAFTGKDKRARAAVTAAKLIEADML